MDFEAPAPYSAVDFSVTLGNLSVSGFGDGEMITLEPPTETVKASVGAMGEVVFSYITNPLAQVKFSLFQNSAGTQRMRNAYYSQFADGGKKPFPLTLRNNRTGEVYRGICAVVQDSGFKVAKEVSAVEWVLLFVIQSHEGATA